MNCMAHKEQISQFLDNELPAEELQPLFHHLSDCEECRKFLVNTKIIHDEIKNVEYVEVPESINKKFALLGMEQPQKSILSRQFTVSVLSTIYSVGGVIVMSLLIYVMGTIQEKEIAERYRQTMNISLPYESTSIDRN